MSEANSGLPFRVIEGKDVDLLEPFPEKELDRLYGWLRRIRTELGGDDTPKSRKDTLAHYRAGLQSHNVTSWGIVDKHNQTQGKIETPLVGFIAFEQNSPYNGNIHIALTKKANDNRLIDEAIRLAIAELFRTLPKLLRVSAFAAQSNWLVGEIADRLDFQREGVCEDFYTNHGEPRNVVLYGLTRRRFEDICRSLHQQYQQSLEGLEPSVVGQQPQEPQVSAERPLAPSGAGDDKQVRPVPGVPLKAKTSPRG